VLDSKAGIFCDLMNVDVDNTELEVEWISYHMLTKWAAKLVSEQNTRQR
jgi:hypothetical protein